MLVGRKVKGAGGKLALRVLSATGSPPPLPRLPASYQHCPRRRRRAEPSPQHDDACLPLCTSDREVTPVLRRRCLRAATGSESHEQRERLAARGGAGHGAAAGVEGRNNGRLRCSAGWHAKELHPVALLLRLRRWSSV